MEVPLGYAPLEMYNGSALGVRPFWENTPTILAKRRTLQM